METKKSRPDIPQYVLTYLLTLHGEENEAMMMSGDECAARLSPRNGLGDDTTLQANDNDELRMKFANGKR